MKERIPGTNTLGETRKESEESVDKKLRYEQIIEILKESTIPLSAKEIAIEMNKKHYVPTSERNFSAPRLTELLKMGIVDCVGKKVCEYTHKTVGVFELCKK